MSGIAFPASLNRAISYWQVFVQSQKPYAFQKVLTIFKKLFFKKSYYKHSNNKIDHEYDLINGWTNVFSQRRKLRQLFRVDPKRIVVARNLVFFYFFFQLCFPKFVKIFLRNPNPNLTLIPTLPRVIFGEEKLCGSDLRDLS